MITGVHAMFYSSKAEELLALIRDKLGLSYSEAVPITKNVSAATRGDRNELRNQSLKKVMWDQTAYK